jgi:TIR domain-containing protein
MFQSLRVWRATALMSAWLLALDAQIHQAFARGGGEIALALIPISLIGGGIVWAIRAGAEADAQRTRDAQYKARVEAARVARNAEEAKRVELNMSALKPEKAAEILALLGAASGTETPREIGEAAAGPGGFRDLGEAILRRQADMADNVNVAVFAPSEAQPADDICVQVLLHTLPQAEQAERQATDMDPEAQKLASITLVVPLKQGDKVKITIDPAQGEIAERTQMLEWTGGIAHSLFFMKLPDAAKLGRVPLEGVALLPKAFIFVNGVPAGFVRFKIVIKFKTAAKIPLPLNETARRYRRAFLSYASEDRVHVLRSAQFLKAMNIEYFQDLLDLEPGQRWERHLYEQIDDCDLFLLFWSRHAAASEWVIKEAKYALDRAAETHDQPEMHPIILEGPPPVEPPASLGHVHFNDPVRYVIFAEEMMAAQRASQA